MNAKAEDKRLRVEFGQRTEARVYNNQREGWVDGKNAITTDEAIESRFRNGERTKARVYNKPKRGMGWSNERDDKRRSDRESSSERDTNEGKSVSHERQTEIQIARQRNTRSDRASRIGTHHSIGYRVRSQRRESPRSAARARDRRESAKTADARTIVAGNDGVS